jgi:hypothetical protein
MTVIARNQGVGGVLRVKLFWVVFFAMLVSTGLVATRLVPDFGSLRPYSLAAVGNERQIAVSGPSAAPGTFNAKLGPLTRTLFTYQHERGAKQHRHRAI